MNTNESGRSMIEMLGVLAIIGILSVGGISGYSKAMSVFKVNKTIDQLTQIAASTRAIFSGHKTYKALTKASGGGGNSCSGDSNMALIKKARLVPDEMLDGDCIENTFGGYVTLTSASKGTRADKAFAVSFAMIPQSACIELATKDWGQGKTSGLWSVTINGTENLASAGQVTVGSAVTACTSPHSNTIVWTFY